MKKQLLLILMLIVACSIFCACQNDSENAQGGDSSTDIVAMPLIASLDSENELQDYYECTAHESEYQSHVIISSHAPLADFRVVRISYVETEESEFLFEVGEELFAADALTPDKPLLLHIEMPEVIPNVGITYLGSDGETKLYTVSASGLDGSPLLTEEPLL